MLRLFVRCAEDLVPDREGKHNLPPTCRLRQEEEEVVRSESFEVDLLKESIVLIIYGEIIILGINRSKYVGVQHKLIKKHDCSCRLISLGLQSLGFRK